MTRRLGIMLATAVMAVLAMSDGALACRCMNRLMNRCGCRRVCCYVCVPSNCCQAVVPACCQAVSTDLKPADGAVKVDAQIVPPVASPSSVTPAPAPSPLVEKPSLPPVLAPDPKLEPRLEVPPPSKPAPLEVPAESRIAPKPEIAPLAPPKVEKPAELPMVPLNAPEPAKTPEPTKTTDKAPDLPKPLDAPKPAEPPKTIELPKAVEPPKAPGLSPTPKKEEKKDDPFGSTQSDVQGLRMWTDASGKYQVQARFVSFQDGAVRLQKANGRFVRIAYDLLCTMDQSLVLNLDQSLVAMEP
jgi:hypothetical protein